MSDRDGLESPRGGEGEKRDRGAAAQPAPGREQQARRVLSLAVAIFVPTISGLIVTLHNRQAAWVMTIAVPVVGLASYLILREQGRGDTARHRIWPSRGKSTRAGRQSPPLAASSGARPGEAAETAREPWRALIRMALGAVAVGAALGALLGAVLGIGYGVRYGFAHDAFWGWLSSACGAVILALLATAVWRDWLAPVHIPHGRAWQAISGALAVAAATWGLALGHGSPLVLCPVPTELRVLTSAEDFAAIKNAIPYFEEATAKRGGCETVDLTAYAPPPASTQDDVQKVLQMWEKEGTALVPDPDIGPPPDVWIPDSVNAVPAQDPAFTNLGIIGYSPVVIAVPEQEAQTSWQNESWAQVYEALVTQHISLAIPNPATSEAALIGLSELYQGPVTSGDERKIESTGTFPQDSESLLCAAGQAAGQGVAQGTAYLASEAAVADYDAHQLAGAACGPAGSAAAVTRLTPVFPAPGAALEFPFVLVKWPAGQSQAARAEARAFYQWLTGPDRYLLGYGGVRASGCTTGGTVSAEPQSGSGDGSCDFPSQMASPATQAQTIAKFNNARVPAQVIIGVDDSGPMAQYLPQITAAIDRDVPGGASDPRDRFAIWELPGAGQQIDTELVRLEPATTANRQRVPGHISNLTGRGHSRNYDVLASAANALWANDSAPTPDNSVIMLTDGDGGSRHQTAVDIERLFRRPHGGRKPIELFIIAFGPAGCTSVMLQQADTTGGTCYAANQSDPVQLLKQLLNQLVGWG